MNDLYPAGPSAVPAELTLPAPGYKQKARLAVASLVLFVGLYLFLSGWFMWTAYRLVQDAGAGGENSFALFMVGVCAVFLAVFMLKALVFVKRGDMSNAIEIKPSDQPRLFQFLNRLADEAGAPRPNKVYLSARVNAAVFYDLSILNFLFPSRKNLEIGLALVNVLTLSEFKAVVAHEFGHFAQRTMAIGSWVYIAQQIAAHIVAKRDILDHFLHGLSRLDIRVAWVGWLMSLIVWSIRSLMDSLLRVVVLAQRALSREMEFQADLVAVSLTGSDELIHALYKLQAADEAWGRALGFADTELRQGRVAGDLLDIQTRVIAKLAHIRGDHDFGNPPKAADVPPETHRVFKGLFARPPTMWSTHPDNVDRENNAKRSYLTAPSDTRSAWLLFDGVDSLKANVVAHLFRDAKADPVPSEQTYKSLDERYGLLQYQPRYRGAYLGRALTRYAETPGLLYAENLRLADVGQALDRLYAPELADQLKRLEELGSELSMLKALHDKVFEPTGGRIVFRGREISRNELPHAINEVTREEAEARNLVLEQDKHCRGVHLAAAEQIGGGWSEYLKGLIAVLHYAEHTLANLRDAQGLLGNVTAVVTATGKVSSGGLDRLLVAGNALHSVLNGIFSSKDQVRLDRLLLDRLGVESWSAMLEEFKLGGATRENINEWMKVVDGWVEGAAGPLSALSSSALESLLDAEERVARQFHEGHASEPPPAASSLPSGYPVLVAGKERQHQRRLGLWGRFLVADGMPAAIARVLVATTIVGSVLGFGAQAGTTTMLSIYNGLGRSVVVAAGTKTVRLAEYSANTIEVDRIDEIVIETKSEDGKQIEQFKPETKGRGLHYVYNVAGAAPLVEWAAVYGSKKQQAPRMHGAPRWLVSRADVFFAAPPDQVRTKAGGATRWVLTGLGERSPDEVLSLVDSKTEQRQVISAHAKWDRMETPHSVRWRELEAE